MSYEAFRQSWGPSWLKNSGGQRWQASHGAFADVLVARWKAAVKAGFPDYAPADAMPYLQSEIGIPRAPGDSDSDYAAKLLRAWELWPFAGTPLGLLLAFEAAGYDPTQYVIVQQEYRAYGLDSNTALPPYERLIIYSLIGDRWTFDWDFTLWSRFGVLFPDSANLPAGWLAGAASPPTAITTPDKDEVNAMITMVRKWKRAAATFEWIRVCTGGAIWGWPVTLEWGAPGLFWGGATVLEWGPNLYP